MYYGAIASLHHFSPEVFPKSPWYVELKLAVHEVAEDRLDLHQHFLVCVLSV